MNYIDLHEKPFDKETIEKLEIFEDYAQAWIPTFVMQSHIEEIHIFDFFAGPGYDSNKVPGSPIRILQKIDEQLGNILSKRTKIVLHLNEFEPTRKSQKKYNQLKQNCDEFISNHPKFKYFLTVNYYNENAEKLFFELLPYIKEYPSLVYLDQNGVKFISQEYVSELEKTEKTDFLYFISSSYFKWFGGTDEFKKFLDIDFEIIKNEEYKNIHKLVCDKIVSRLPKHSDLKLFPFTIKKKANIYGIVFGAKNYAAVDKFLRIAWKRNTLNGAANFDIEEDECKKQLDLFEEVKLTKIERFQKDFELLVLKGSFTNNKDAIIFTYGQGHIAKHADEVLRKLKKKKKIDYDGATPAINYENVFRNRNIVDYKIL